MTAAAATASNAKIHPTAIVDRDVELGRDVEIGPYCIVSGPVRLGDSVKMLSHAQVLSRTTIGAGCEIWPFAVLGGPPQIANYQDADTTLTIGEKCVIREHVTMHRGSSRGHSATVIGDNCLFMVGSHVAHDCRVGNNAIFANNASVGGHCQIEDFVFLGGLCALHQYTRVGKHAFIGGVVPVTADVIPYGMVSNTGYLDGLNVVGLRRRGFSREQIHDLRAAYRLVFAEEGTLQERLDDATELFAQRAEVMEIIKFIRDDAQRPLLMPSSRRLP